MGEKSARYLQIALNEMGIEIRWNERNQRGEYKGKGDWEQRDSLALASLRETLAEKYYIFTGRGEQPYRLTMAQMGEFSAALMHKNRVDPFLEWLETLPEWDQKPRLNGLLVSFFGADDTVLNHWASRYFFIGAIQRAKEPGCKLDEFPILIGDQGIGKSAFLRNLFPKDRWDWFNDQISVSAPAKERVESLQGRVIVEFGEMQGYTSKHLEDMKAFLTRQDDGGVRLAYRMDPQTHLRRCIFVGTSNDPECLPNDWTGLRRFVPVHLERGVDVEKELGKVRDQLWAEGMRYWNDGIRANLPRDMIHAQTVVAEQSRRRDDLYEDMVDRITVEEGTITELCEFESPTHSELKRFSFALRAGGWRPERVTENGKQIRIWRVT